MPRTPRLAERFFADGADYRPRSATCSVVENPARWPSSSFLTASKYAPPLHALSQHSGQGRLHAVAAEEEVCQAARDDNEAPQASGEAEQRLVEQNCRNFRRADLRIGDGQRAPRTVPTLLAAGQRVHTPLGGGVVKATKLGGWVVVQLDETEEERQQAEIERQKVRETNWRVKRYMQELADARRLGRRPPLLVRDDVPPLDRGFQQPGWRRKGPQPAWLASGVAAVGGDITDPKHSKWRDELASLCQPCDVRVPVPARNVTASGWMRGLRVQAMLVETDEARSQALLDLVRDATNLRFRARTAARKNAPRDLHGRLRMPSCCQCCLTRAVAHIRASGGKCRAVQIKDCYAWLEGNKIRARYTGTQDLMNDHLEWSEVHRMWARRPVSLSRIHRSLSSL